jgi:hypothetical protein
MTPLDAAVAMPRVIEPPVFIIIPVLEIGCTTPALLYAA